MDVIGPGPGEIPERHGPQPDRGAAAGMGYEEAAGYLIPDHTAGREDPGAQRLRTIETIDDLMSRSWRDWVITDGEAIKAWDLLEALPDGQLSGVVATLDQGATLGRLLSNLPRHVREARPLSILRVWQHRKRDDHHDLREAAITAIERSGQDPDQLLDAYGKMGLWPFFATQKQVMVTDQNDDGTWVTKTFHGVKAYDIGITASEVVVVVRLRLEAMGGVGSLDDEKERWLTGIKARWNDQYVVSNGIKTYPLRFRPLFVGGKPGDRPFALDVRVKPGAGRSNEKMWYEDDEGDTTVSHEFGHVLGAPDEYDIPTYDRHGRVVGEQDVQDSIMSDYGSVQPRHLEEVLADLNFMRGQQPAFELKPPGHSDRRGAS